MINYEINLKLNALPFWKGARRDPGSLVQLPFVLGWDSRGFIRQLTPRDVQQKVIEGYASDEYTFITAPPGASPWANRLGDCFLNFIRKSCGSLAGMKVLEIGAGSTYIASKLVNDNGAADYLIMDPGIKESSDDARIKILREYFSCKTSPKGTFDLLVSINCLEHVEDPIAFLVEAHAVMKVAGARFVLIFPDSDEMFRNGDPNVLLHEHLNCFTMESATRVLKDCGFGVLAAETYEDCLYFMLDASGTPQATPPAYPMDLILPLAAVRFQESLEHIRRHVGESLARGERVAFHGANNGLNNALALAGLANDDRITVFDGDEAKTGRYLPACPVPIRHSSDPEYRKMGRVFIAALTFYSEIRGYVISKTGLEPSRILPLIPRLGPGA